MKSLKSAMLIVFCQFLLFSAGAQFPTINVTTNTNPSNGYTFIASFWTGTAGTYYLLILDKQGRIIYAKSFPTSMNGGFLDFKPQPNYKYSFFDGKQGRYYIMDKNFNIIDTVVAKNGYSTNNHELIMSKDNHYFLIADETRTMDLSTIVSGGKPNAQVTGNIIQEIDTNDKLLFQWKVLDHISITDYAGDLTAPSFDFAHTNSLFLDTDSTILMCNPALNEITKINLNNGNIIWRLGLQAHSNQFTFINDTLGFIFQHYVSRLPNGNITLFDNGLGRFARAVEYEIDEVNKTAKQVFQFRQSPDVNGPSMGSVIRLANGNTFICWGSVTKMTEVDTAGKKVFEASFPSCTYRALKYDIPSPISHLISGPSEICEGQTATYTANPGTNCTFFWTITNGSIISGQGTNILTVKWPTKGPGTVRLTKTNSLNYKDYFLIYVTVLPSPEANMGVVQICNGARFIDSSTNSVYRFWNFDDGDTSILTDVVHIYSAPGTYQVKLKVINSYGCADSNEKLVIIPEEPKADLEIDSIVCINDIISIINNSTDADGCFWYLGDSMISNLKNPPAFSFPEIGSYLIKLIVTGSGCSDTLSKKVLVNPSPKAHFTITEICHGARFTDSSINALYRIWDFDDGDTSILTDVNHIYRSPGTYQVKLKIINSYGCADSSIQTVIIPDTLKADFSIDSFVCINEKITIINNSINAVTYFWDMGNSMTSNLKNPLTFLYPKAGTYNVKLFASASGCNDSFAKTVLVYPNPKAHFSFSEICNGARFIDSSINSVFRLWDFNDGDTSLLTDVDHIYNSPGTYQVKLIAVNSYGCTDSITQTVIIPDAPKADFSMDTNVCRSETTTIINTSTNADGYYWYLRDSLISVLKNPLAFSFPAVGTYDIKLIVTGSGCIDSLTKTVIVNPNPQARISLREICNGAGFKDSTINSVYRIWYFGDGDTSILTDVDHIYSSPGTYQVKLNVFNNQGCSDSAFESVIIHKAPKADFNINAVVCASDAISIINNSTDADGYFWYSGDSTFSNLKHPLAFSLPSDGSYDIKLIVTGSGCLDSITKTVIVNANPQARISLREICHGARFTDSSINALHRIWDFGDGDTSILTDPDHIYSSPGTYQVKLKVIDNQGCIDSTVKSVIIHKAPKADFNIDSIVCASETISIINNSTDAITYFWDLGDSRTSHIMTPEAFSFKTAGSYQIKLVASTLFCSDSLIQSVFVIPDPEVKFGSTKLTDSTIQFYDSSTISSGTIISWEWSFGDGITSTLQNPFHIYSSTGTYIVELCVISNEGCKDCENKSIVVTSTGINRSVIDNSISVFPNPNKGTFTIKSSKKLNLIVISNTFGQEILVVKPKTDTEFIDLTNKPKGVYIVKVRFENYDQMIKIIKN